MRFLLIALILSAQLMAGNAFAANKSVEGLWATEGEEAIIEIYKCNEDSICGRFYKLSDEDPMKPSRDNRNLDKNKRTRLLCGLKLLGDFASKGEGGYGSGWIYSPRHGTRFSASMRLLSDDRLELRGYFLFSLLGDSQIWTRKENAKACHFLAAAPAG